MVHGLLGVEWQLHYAESCAAAFAELGRSQRDLVVLDLLGWSRSELELLPTLGALWDGARAVALVPEAEPAALRRSLGMPELEVILDPPDVERLAEALSPTAPDSAPVVASRAPVEDAELVGAALARLLRGLAHHLRNPLTGVSGHIELLNAPEAPADAERHEHCQTVIRELRRVERVVRDLERFVGDRRPQRRPVAGRALLESVSRTVGSDIRLATSCQPVDLELLVDEARLAAALVDLVRWSAAGESDAVVRLAVRAIGDEMAPSVQIRIRGPRRGPLPQPSEDVFLPYHELETRVDRAGLGLAAAFGVFRGHGGKLDAAEETDGTIVLLGSVPAPERSTD